MDSERVGEILNDTVLGEFPFLTSRFIELKWEVRYFLTLDSRIEFMVVVEFNNETPVSMSIYKQVNGDDVTDDDYWEMSRDDAWEDLELRMRDVANVLREDPDIKIRKDLHDKIAALQSELKDLSSLINALMKATPDIKVKDQKKYLKSLTTKMKACKK